MRCIRLFLLIMLLSSVSFFAYSLNKENNRIEPKLENNIIQNTLVFMKDEDFGKYNINYKININRKYLIFGHKTAILSMIVEEIQGKNIGKKFCIDYYYDIDDKTEEITMVDSYCLYEGEYFEE